MEENDQVQNSYHSLYMGRLKFDLLFPAFRGRGREGDTVSHYHIIL